MTYDLTHPGSDRAKTINVRVDSGTHAKLANISKDLHRPIRHVLAEAVEQYRRQRILQQTNDAYAALRADPEAWREVEAERALWDRALEDGLEDER
jgi:predicted transcriptional regulator